MKTEDILNEREKTHGDYSLVAKTYSELKKSVKREYAPWLSAQHMLALEMICLKMARIIHGDPNFADHWDDIAGYAMLGKGGNESRANPDAAINFWEEGSNKPKEDYQLKEKCFDCTLSMNYGDKGLLCDKHMREQFNRYAERQKEKEEWHPVEKCICIDCEQPYMGIPGLKGRCCECIKKQKEEFIADEKDGQRKYQYCINGTNQ